MKKIVVILLFIPVLIWGQTNNRGSVFFIKNFTPEDYNGERQNFDVVTDRRGFVYFANAGGYILEYDGINWTKILVSNTAVRSLAVDSKNTIYVGTGNDFGYLKTKNNGEFRFVSLKNKIPEQHPVVNIWQTLIINDSIVVFLSQQALFVYNSNSGKINIIDVEKYNPHGIFLKAFVNKGKLFVFLKKSGIYSLNDNYNSLTFVPNSGVFSNLIVVNMLEINGKQYIFTYEKGIFLHKNNAFVLVNTPIDNFIRRNFRNILKINDNFLVITTLNNGFILVDTNFNLLQSVNSNSGLSNDIILDLTTDKNDILWLALDNGIARVFLFSPFYYYGHYFGFEKLTKIYSATLLNGKLYLGTPNGIYYRDWQNTNDYLLKPKAFYDKYNKKTSLRYVIKPNMFLRLDDTNGIFRIFKLKNLNDTVFLASTFGLAYLTDNTLPKYIIKKRTVYNFLKFQNKLLAISQNLTIVQKKNNFFLILDTLYNISGRTLAYDKKQNIFWFASETQGIYKVKFSPDFKKIEKLQFFNAQNGLKGLPSQVKNKVYSYFGKIYFTTAKGVYGYDYQRDTFYKDPVISKFVDDKYVNLLYIDSAQNIWVKYMYTVKDKTIWQLAKISKTDTGYQFNSGTFNPLRNKIYSFKQLSKNLYLIGLDDGFVIYDDKIKTKQNVFRSFIKKVEIINTDSIIYANSSNDSVFFAKQPEIKYAYRNLKFDFAVNYFLSNVEFSFYLEGFDKDWSPWTSQSFKEYANLPPGTYTFKLRAKNIFDQVSDIAEFSFTILPPWYRTTLAYILYVILSGLLIWLIVYLYTLRLKRQKQHLEELVKQRTREIEKQKDILERQNKEISQKNKEITASINYAQRIQKAILPLHSTISQYLDEYFIFFRPRDIVSGDFYWFTYHKGKIIIAAVDCTGHGVPGAFMSILGSESLNTIVKGMGITDPAQILEMQDQLIKNALKQEETDTKDGMDMAICVIDKEKNILEFAGAKNPLVYIKDNQLFQVKATRRGIGEDVDIPFKKETVIIDKPTWFYIFSDGYKDQFGGGKQMRKFMKKFFYELLFEIHTKPAQEQQKILEQRLLDWMNGYSQTDDILVIGFKLEPTKKQ